MKYATPINRAIVYNPQTGRNVPESGEYVVPDQHFLRREKEGTVKLTDRPAAPKSAKSSKTVKKDGDK